MSESVETHILLCGKETATLAKRLAASNGLKVSVFTSQTLEQSISIIREYDFAVIIIISETCQDKDLNVTKTIGKYVRLKPTPILFYTTDTIKHTREEAIYRSGATDILTDTVSDMVLFSKISFFADLFRHRVTTETLSADQLKASAEKYKSIFDNSRDGIVFMSLEGHIENANQAYCDMLGYDIQDLIFTTSVQHTPEKWHERDAEILKSQVMVRGYSEEFKKEYIRQNNMVFPVMVRVCLVRDKEGQPLRLLKIVRDITEQSQLEMRLRQSHKMESVGTIAGGIAHDFNNILGAIIGYAQLAKYNVTKNSPASEDIENIIIASGRAKDLVTHILGFSRATEQTRQPVQLHFLVNEALKLIRASLPTTIEIKRRIATKNTSILADPTEMHQIIMNLCTNAYHAMEESLGVLEITLKPVDISSRTLPGFHTLQDGPYVQLRVKDTGAGIPPDIMERIFDPYFTTKEKGAGTGLGLSVVHGIVQSHGGSIDVLSEPGNGTTITILFPRLEIASDSKQEVIKPLDSGSEKILFVDDEPSLVYVEKVMLQKLGYHVISAPSGVEAFDIFSMRPDFFDIIITDMTMPGMTGIDLAEKIHSMRPETPIILCTGYNAKLTDDKAYEKGISKILLKPVEIRDLSTAIRELLKT